MFCTKISHHTESQAQSPRAGEFDEIGDALDATADANAN
jgi:hypothetical protein